MGPLNPESSLLVPFGPIIAMIIAAASRSNQKTPRHQASWGGAKIMIPQPQDTLLTCVVVCTTRRPSLTL
jgi:hypothetical protein